VKKEQHRDTRTLQRYLQGGERRLNVIIVSQVRRGDSAGACGKAFARALCQGLKVMSGSIRETATKSSSMTSSRRKSRHLPRFEPSFRPEPLAVLPLTRPNMKGAQQQAYTLGQRRWMPPPPHRTELLPDSPATVGGAHGLSSMPGREVGGLADRRHTVRSHFRTRPR
jgi:hypothetical protein